MGRALTGLMPRDSDEKDFRPFTCGVSKFVRRKVEVGEAKRWKKGLQVPDVGWRGRGVGGGWDCAMNGSCEHLSRGEERGWSVEYYSFLFVLEEGSDAAVWFFKMMYANPMDDVI